MQFGLSASFRPLSEALRTPLAADKKFCAIVLRNPLKSHDSDERIQGNPNKSNPLKSGCWQETVRGQENPNKSTGSMSRTAGKAPGRLIQGQSTLETNRALGPVHSLPEPHRVRPVVHRLNRTISRSVVQRCAGVGIE